VAISQKVELFCDSALGVLESCSSYKSNGGWRRRVQTSCSTKRSPHGMSVVRVGSKALLVVGRALVVA